MENKTNKRSEQVNKEAQPGDMSSFNNRDVKRSAETEDAETTRREKDKRYSKNNDGKDIEENNR